MRKKIIVGTVAFGITLASILGIKGCPDIRDTHPSKLYYINADNKKSSDQKHDDLVARYKDRKTTLLLRNPNGVYENAEDLRKKELSDVEKNRDSQLEKHANWYNKEREKIKTAYHNLREALDKKK